MLITNYLCKETQKIKNKTKSLVMISLLFLLYKYLQINNWRQYYAPFKAYF